LRRGSERNQFCSFTFSKGTESYEDWNDSRQHVFQTNPHQQRHDKSSEFCDTGNQILERVSQQQRLHPVPEHRMRCNQLGHTTRGVLYPFMFCPKNSSTYISQSNIKHNIQSMLGDGKRHHDPIGTSPNTSFI
jgi:hypothetical protein